MSDDKELVPMFGKPTTYSYAAQRIVIALRKESLEEGVDPVDFPEWLKARGVEAVGVNISISSSLIVFDTLKHQNS